MAWNPSPQVAIARDAAGKLGANRVVIVYTNDKGQIGYASYGDTRSLCDQTKRLADTLYDAAMRWWTRE